MMLRQEAALDHSIDRKVRILLRLRKESIDHPMAPAGQDDGGRMENIEDVPESDIVSAHSQGVETVESLKMNERRGNVVENKGSRVENRPLNWNVHENKGSYLSKAGMLLKRNGVIGNEGGEELLLA
jgi:hypothetical protein